MLKALLPAAIAAAFTLGAAAAAAAADDWRKLLTPAELAQMIADEAGAPVVRVLDIRAPEGEGGFAAGHIPGAINTPYGAYRGPAENPGELISDEALTQVLRAAGVAEGDAVVIAHQGANDSEFGAAARVYWTLKSAGFDRLAIVNGGYQAWAEAGLPVSTEAAAVTPSDITVTIADDWLATREDVQQAEASGSAVLVDARPDAFFRGERKHDAAREPGTIFGAISLVHDAWFAPASPVVSVSDAALDRARALAAEAGDRDIVSFCNTGHWAATNWFALSELAGVEGVKLYPESTVGWSRAGLPLSPGG